MDGKKLKPIYRVIRGLVALFYPKIEIVGTENLPDGPCVVVANHAQMNGPITAELYFPGKRAIWCAAEMMEFKEVAHYAFTDFWSFKPRWVQPFYRLLSHLIAPISVIVFNNAHTIPVHRDARIMSTFRETIAALEDGASVIIFPERNAKHNHVVYDFQEGFVDVARLYRHKTGRDLCFVPAYITPKLRKMVIGAPVRCDPANKLDAERRRVCDRLMDDITRLAVELPPHTIVPYRNIPRREYPSNRPQNGERSA